MNYDKLAWVENILPFSNKRSQRVCVCDILKGAKQQQQTDTKKKEGESD